MYFYQPEESMSNIEIEICHTRKHFESMLFFLNQFDYAYSTYPQLYWTEIISVTLTSTWKPNANAFTKSAALVRAPTSDVSLHVCKTSHLWSDITWDDHFPLITRAIIMASTYFNLHVSGFEVESHLEPQMFYDGSENLHPVLFQRSVPVRRNRYLPHLNSSSLKQQQHRFISQLHSLHQTGGRERESSDLTLVTHSLHSDLEEMHTNL